MRGAADRLDPPDLHRRLCQRSLRRREPALLSSAAQLIERLALSDEELVRILGTSPLAIVSGEADALPQVPILLALAQAAADQVGDAVLRRWLRSNGPIGRPIDQLLAHDFGAFEVAIEDLIERGFVLRSPD